MAENNYFREALSDFAFDAANGGVIRHLAVKGYTVKQIMGQLDIPVSYERVRREVWKVLTGSGVILLQEPGSQVRAPRERYVEERGRYGKKSFRKIMIPEEESGKAEWDVTEIEANWDGLPELLAKKCQQNGRDRAYLSCDYGMLDAGRYAEVLECLEERQREYVDGLPWIGHRVYHRIDQRMSEILRRQLCGNLYDGSCYFANLNEKIILR